MIRLTIALFLLFLTIPGGCEFLNQPASLRSYRYKWGFINRSTETLMDVAIHYVRGERMDSDAPGVLSPGGVKTSDLGRERVPTEVSLHWKTEDGEVHNATLDISTLAPHGQDFENATIWFSYTGTEWKSSVLTRDDVEKRRKAGIRGFYQPD